MTRILFFSAVVLGAAVGCSGPQPVARIPSSGVTASVGGGEVELGNSPRGTTLYPMGQPPLR